VLTEEKMDEELITLILSWKIAYKITIVKQHTTFLTSWQVFSDLSDAEDKQCCIYTVGCPRQPTIQIRRTHTDPVVSVYPT
jgi:hypothetical protein